MAHEGPEQQLNLIGSAVVCARLRIDRSTLIRRVQLGRIKYAARLPGKTGPYLFDPAYVDQLVREGASLDDEDDEDLHRAS